MSNRTRTTFEPAVQLAEPDSLPRTTTLGKDPGSVHSFRPGPTYGDLSKAGGRGWGPSPHSMGGFDTTAITFGGEAPVRHSYATRTVTPEIAAKYAASQPA